MKLTTVILSLLALSSTASASFFQGHCSNATGTTKTASGHISNFITISNIEYNDDYEKIVTEIPVDYKNHKTELVSESIILQDSSEHCSESGGGYFSAKTVSYKIIKISKTNRSLFPKTIAGVSKDRTFVTARLLCEREVSNQIRCERP